MRLQDARFAPGSKAQLDCIGSALQLKATVLVALGRLPAAEEALQDARLVLSHLLPAGHERLAVVNSRLRDVVRRRSTAAAAAATAVAAAAPEAQK